MDTGELAWAVTATALVVLMTPGVAFFYGGLVKAKSVVSMMMMSFGALGLISVLWILYGFNMSAVDSTWGFAGNPFADFGLMGLTGDNEGLIGAAFGATFAIITVALISGAIADRAKFGSWMVFAGLWATLVYFPAAAWVFGGGWILNMTAEDGLFPGLPGVIDYAGGTLVHINAGAAALALALVLGKRVVFEKGAHKPHNVPLVLLGASLLWFGWFGFNAGSALAADGFAANAFVQTNTAAAMGAITWMGLTWWKSGKPSIVGACLGAVAGLVAITPAAGFVGLWPDLDHYGNIFPALIIGAGASLFGFYAIGLLHRVKELDDVLDVFAVHGVGGLWGAFATGLFAVAAYAGGANGLVEGSFDLLWRQLGAMGAALGWSFVVSGLIMLAIKQFMAVRVEEDEELAGLDRSEHDEPAYQFDEAG